MESSGGGGEGDKGRLPTFKCPRDLSLTGKLSPLLRSRKTFVPNIPPKRDRPVPSPEPSPSTSPQPVTPRGGQRGRGRGRDAPGRERKKPDLVQASSIFSDGVGDGEKGKRFGGSRGSRFGGGGGGGEGGGKGRGQGRIGALDSDKFFRSRDEEAGKMLEGNLTFQEVHAKVHELIGDGKFIADLNQDEDIDQSLQGVELPLSAYLASSMKEIKRIPVPLKPELFNSELKTELDPSAVPALESDTLDPLSLAHSVLTAPPDGTIIFFQMPDQLPVLDQPGSDSMSTGEVKAAKLSTEIGSLPEGYIGKMQVFASGATRLLLGENSFDILPSKPVSFRQELVAIDLDNKKMTALGPVKNKFLVIPDLEQLFRQSL